jgi:hypothetical protein
MICASENAVVALAKRPAGFSESEWEELEDAAVDLVREADPDALAGTVDAEK